jgi:hypothetical protein
MRLENSIQLGQNYQKQKQYRYTYRRVKIDQSTLVIDPELIPLFSLLCGWGSYRHHSCRTNGMTRSTRGADL